MGLLCQNSINISLRCLPKVDRGENLSVHLFLYFPVYFKMVLRKSENDTIFLIIILSCGQGF